MRLSNMKAALACVALAACSTPRVPKTYALDELDLSEWTGGLPVRGNGTVIVALSSTEPEDWRTVSGYVALHCDGCVLGAPDAALQLPEPMGDVTSVPFGALELGTVTGRADFADGRVHVTLRWRSDDIELDARVDGELGETAADTVIDGCVTFRPVASLQARDPKLFALLTITGAPQAADGTFQIALDGKLGAMRRLGKLCQ